MKFVNNIDFLRILKAKFFNPTLNHNDVSFLNSIDFALLNHSEIFADDSYYKYLGQERRDVLKNDNPYLHLLNWCFIEPELRVAYFSENEVISIQKVRQELEFFGSIEFETNLNMPLTSFNISKEWIKGFCINKILSEYFSKYFLKLYIPENNFVIKNWVQDILSVDLDLNFFINIEVNDLNVEFFSEPRIQDFLKSLDILICFDFRHQEAFSPSYLVQIEKFLNFIAKTESSNNPFIILVSETILNTCSKLDSNNCGALLIQSTESDLFVPWHIGENRILSVLPNRFYLSSPSDFKYFYFGFDYEYLFELNEVILRRLDIDNPPNSGTLIYVKQLNVAGTELLSNSFNDFLNSIKLPSFLLFESYGSLVENINYSKSDFLQVPSNPFLLKYVFETLIGMGYVNIVSFTSANLSVIELAEKAGFKSFIFLNENLPELKSLGVDEKELLDKSIPNRKIIVNSFSTHNLSRDNIIEIPTSVPSFNSEKLSNYQASLSKDNLGMNGKIVIGTLASGIFRKGIDRLQQILDVLPPNMVYLWVGEADPKFLPSSDNFVHVKFMSREEFYSIIDIYSCLSRNDPFPMAVTEAFIQNIPIVAYGDQSCGQIAMREFQDINVSEECAEAFVKILEILCQKKSLNEDSANYDLSLRINYSSMAFNKRILTMLDISPPSISVVLPYFNHKDYILERLTSIIDQQIPINEIIALDNNSSDSGFDLVTNFLEKQDIFNFTVLRNSINNGNVFKQWHKGVSTSTSDYVWITETDDSAHPSFLADLLPMLQDPSVVIATSNSKLIDSKGELIGLGNNIYEGISNPQRFSSSYVNDGHREIYEAIGICNTIPNVSACIFRRKDLLQALDTLGDYLYTFKYAGDWLVYIQLLTQGSIAYNANSLNLFRQHQDSNIRLANKRKLLEEIEEVQNYAKNKIKSDNSFIMSQNLYLEDVRRHLDLS